MPEAGTWSLGTHERLEFESRDLTNLRHYRISLGLMSAMVLPNI